MANQQHRLISGADLHSVERTHSGNPNGILAGIQGQYCQDILTGDIYRSIGGSSWELILGYDRSTGNINNVNFRLQSSRIGVLRGVIGSGTVSSIPAYLYTQVRTGEEIFITSAQDSDVNITFTVSEDTNAGIVSIPVQPQITNKIFGLDSYIELDKGIMSAYQSVDPTKIQLGVELERGANSFGYLANDILTTDGSITTINLDGVSGTVNMYDGQNLVLISQNGSFQFVSVDGDQTITAPSDQVQVVSFNPENNYFSDRSFLGEPSYQTSSRVTIAEGLIDLNAQNITGVSESVSSLSLRVDDAEAEAVLKAEVTSGEITKIASVRLDSSVATGSAITLAADQIRINGTTTFDSGYDPSTKETPDGAQDKADTAESNAITTSRNNIAENLGYTDYADMVSEATAGNTVIDGGFIRTSLIQVNNLFAQNASITGQLTIGSSGYIESSNYNSGSTGFRINADGTAEFMQVTVDGSIVTGPGSSIDGEYIENIDAGTITVGTISADRIGANSITAEKIAANTITASEIAAGTITATEIASNTITANQIASNTITATQIAAGTITATQIATGTITASNISSGTITATQIASNTITANQIATGTITANELAADSVTADKINVTNLNAVNADTGSLNVNGALTVASGGSLSGSNYSFNDAGGNVAGWIIGNDVLQSDQSGNARIELRKSQSRISVVNDRIGGYISSATTTVITVNGKNWDTNQFTGLTLSVDGTERTISSNTEDTITVSTAYPFTPSGFYEIIYPSDSYLVSMGYLSGLAKNKASGTITSSTTSTITDSTKDWQEDQLVGLTLSAGGFTRTISSNTSTQITVSQNFTVAPSGSYQVTFPSNAYGFWAKDGDYLRIDGDLEYESGDWIIKNDGSLKVLDSLSREIIRLGTDTGAKGLFLYDTSGNKLAQYRSDAVIIGDDTSTEYLKYQSGVLTVRGSINADDISTGTLDASSVTVSNINASNITTGTIDASSITVSNINASNITTGTIDASIITVSNISATNITTGTLDVNRLDVDEILATNATIDATLSIGASGQLYYDSGTSDGNGIVKIDRAGLTLYANDVDTIGIQFGNSTTGTTAIIKPTLSGHIAVVGDIISGGSITATIGNIRGNFQSSDGSQGINTTQTWYDSGGMVTHSVTVKDGLITSWTVS